jgi:hypothetical protein
MRAKGVVVTLPVTNPTGYYADEAKKRQQQKQERIIARRENFVMLNKHRYPNMYEKWLAKGKGKLPNCPVCREYTIQWNEPAHVCEGYKPQFVERTEEEWEERRKEFLERRKVRWEEQREMIREAKANGQFYDDCEDDNCDVDYDEGDYCEGDDDGWECEDDGDTMYD